MKLLKKGDIVSRKSYNNDILFFIDDIISNDYREKIAILKGVNIRILANAPLSDLELPSKSRVNKITEDINNQIEHRAVPELNVYGKILHLDRR